MEKTYSATAIKGQELKQAIALHHSTEEDPAPAIDPELIDQISLDNYHLISSVSPLGADRWLASIITILQNRDEQGDHISSSIRLVELVLLKSSLKDFYRLVIHLQERSLQIPK